MPFWALSYPIPTFSYRTIPPKWLKRIARLTARKRLNYGGPNGPSTTVFGKLPFPSNFHFHRNSTSIELLLPWSFHFHDLAFHCFVRHALTTMCSAHAQFKLNGSVTAPAAQIVLVGDVHRIQIRLTLVDLPGHLCIFLL